MAKMIFNTFAFLIAIYVFSTTVRAQSVESDSVKRTSAKPVANDPELEKKVYAKIAQTNWVAAIKSMDARKLENLKKWHQFPANNNPELNATDSNEALAAAIRAWYKEKPAERAKVILSIE